MHTSNVRRSLNLGEYDSISNLEGKNFSRAWFRSTDLWVMGPARFHCATLLFVSCKRGNRRKVIEAEIRNSAVAEVDFWNTYQLETYTAHQAFVMQLTIFYFLLKLMHSFGLGFEFQLHIALVISIEDALHSLSNPYF